MELEEFGGGFETDYLPGSNQVPSYGGNDGYDELSYQEPQVSISYGNNHTNSTNINVNAGGNSLSNNHHINNHINNGTGGVNYGHGGAVNYGIQGQHNQNQYSNQVNEKYENQGNSQGGSLIINEEKEELPVSLPVPIEETRAYKNSKPAIIVSNVVCNYRCRTHLNLRDIAMKTKHVIYKRDQGKVMMKIRNPKMMANIWSSGKIVCQGARSEADAIKGARRFARILYKSGHEKVKVSNYKVVNVLGNCKFPFAIDIMRFSETNAGPRCSYEPELHPAVTYRSENTATIKIFSTGAITLLGRNVALIHDALDRIYPLIFPHRKKRSDDDIDYKSEDDEEIL
jgi:transcription initiation factor TFIID TATA-box-binding protein